MTKPVVALRIRCAESLQPGVDLDRRGTALDPGVLGRHTGPRMTAPHDLIGEEGPAGSCVLATADVEPLGDERAAEVGSCGTADDHAGREVGRITCTQLEASIGRGGAGGPNNAAARDVPPLPPGPP